MKHLKTFESEDFDDKHMANTFWYRHFLICNKMANDIMNVKPQNFAKLILEEDSDRFMNSQMTKYFYSVDATLCDMIGNDEGFMWDELNMEEVSEISPEQLERDYQEYCSGKISLNI